MKSDDESGPPRVGTGVAQAEGPENSLIEKHSSFDKLIAGSSVNSSECSMMDGNFGEMGDLYT